ncbi:unnamed protein product [Diatraea saccharalis]|uniref:Rabaptin GTPase-Rab5 binding domain-containing protein n=1 Tax=Diatraea saccharalis TaxID=40085 RepID=A0A9N9R0B9_9NEOP|nr:unnamed protein product [Diatraea saccharalis]
MMNVVSNWSGVYARVAWQEVSLAPATLVRTLARKLGADDSEPATKRNMEDNELVQSIIQPLNDEIAVLKEKLRDTDTQLQDALKSKSTKISSPAPNSAGSSGDNKPETEVARRCDMCANYEKQLVSEQARADQARANAHRLEAALKLATEELEGVRAVHDETVRAWGGARAAAAAAVADARAAAAAADAAARDHAAAAAAAQHRALQLVTTLTVDRETLQRKLDTLEKDNAYLVGEYVKKAAEMQNEIIDLPDNVEKMNELEQRWKATPAQADGSHARLQEEFQEFKTETLSVLQLLRYQISGLCRCIDDIEMRHRRKYLLVGSVAEDSNDLPKSIVSIFVNKMGLALSQDKLSACHRLGNAAEGRCRPVLVRFTDLTLRAAVWKKKTALKGTPHTISEFLTRQRRDVFINARKRFGIRRCWTMDGNVIVKLKNGSRQRIFTDCDLSALPVTEDELLQAADPDFVTRTLVSPETRAKPKRLARAKK